MTNNKQYPYSFKQDIAYKIGSDVNTDDALKKYVLKHHTSYTYNDLKLSQHISRFVRLFQLSVTKICDYKVIKNLIGEEHSNSIQNKCNNMRRGYYSSAKRAMENLEMDEEKLYERMLLVGHNMMREHLNISNGQTDKPEETKKRILKLSTGDKSLLIESCISDDIKSLPFILNVLYPDNEDERYIIVERAISYLDENNYKKSDNRCSIESIYNQLNLRDGNRNFQLLKQLINNTDGLIECSDLPKFGLQNDQDKLEVTKLLLSYNVHHDIIPSFDLLDIQSEDIRFEIAKLVAQKDSYIGKYLEKFNIIDSSKLQELADINSQNIETKKGNLQPVNANFINHALKFKLPDDKLIEFIDRTLTSDTVFQISDSLFTNKEMILPLLKKILSISSKYYFLQQNLGHLFNYLNQLAEEESTLYYSEIGKYLTAQENAKNVIKILKVFLEEGQITNEQYSNIFEAFYCEDLSVNILNKYKIKDYIHLLTFTGYGNIHPSPFSTRQDIVTFISALEKGGYIDSHIKAAILSENHHFEQLKNFVTLLFEGDTNILHLGTNIDDISDPKQLSRQLFFNKIGLKFPKNKEKYHKDRIQEFYLATYRLYKIIGGDFFKNLQLDESVFQKNHLTQLTVFFNTVLNIISIKNSNKHRHIDQYIIKSISKYNFSHLDENTPEDMDEVFIKCNNIGNITINTDNLTEIVNNFLNILVYTF